MTRLSKLATREDIASGNGLLAAYDLEAFDFAVPAGTENLGEYRGVLMHSPPFANALSHLGKLVRTRGEFEGSYSHRDREFVNIVLGYDFPYPLEIGTHLGAALDAGVRMEAVDALREGREENLNDDERQLATYIRQVVSGTVTDESYAEMEKRLGVRGAVEYTVFVAFLNLVMRLFQAFDISGPTQADVDELIQGFRDGTRELPDHRVHQRKDAVTLWKLENSDVAPREVSVP
jgi:hypothetical protein